MAQSRKKGRGKKAVAEKKSERVSVKTFLSEVRSEFGKVTWPGRKQTVASTVAVIVMSAMLAVYLGAVDLLLGKLVGLILD